MSARRHLPINPAQRPLNGVSNYDRPNGTTTRHARSCWRDLAFVGVRARSWRLLPFDSDVFLERSRPYSTVLDIARLCSSGRASKDGLKARAWRAGSIAQFAPVCTLFGKRPQRLQISEEKRLPLAIGGSQRGRDVRKERTSNAEILHQRLIH